MHHAASVDKGSNRDFAARSRTTATGQKPLATTCVPKTIHIIPLPCSMWDQRLSSARTPGRNLLGFGRFL